MAEDQSKFKQYIPIISIIILLICAILLCVVASCKNESMLYFEITISGSISLWNWTVPLDTSSGETLGWDVNITSIEHINATDIPLEILDLDACTGSGSAIGAFSIIGIILIIVSAAAFVYFELFTKTENKVFSVLYHRQLLMIASIILLVAFLVSSILYYSECSDILIALYDLELWTISIEVTDIAPAYGMILLWVACCTLLFIAVLNSAIFRWKEEVGNNNVANVQTTKVVIAHQPPNYTKYSTVPTKEQTTQPTASPMTNRSERLPLRQDGTVPEQMRLTQDKDEESLSEPPPPPFNADLVPR